MFTFKIAKILPITALIICATPAIGNADETNPHFALANKKGEIYTPQPSSDEEAFLVRRIAEFWKDGDFAIVKSQIRDFFDQFPESPLHDYFHGLLGDLYLQENQVEKALGAYEKITDLDVKEKILINKLHCLYALDRYEELQKEATPYIGYSHQDFLERKDEFSFLIAESLFRQSLTEDRNERKEELCVRAKPFYENLGDTPYASISEFALAEIYRMLEDYEKAATLYGSLAKKHENEREDLLFQKASMQSYFDLESSLASFQEVFMIRGKRESEALFNHLVIAFQLSKYDTVIDEHEDVTHSLSEENRSTYEYIVGKSYFAKNDFENSRVHLQAFVELVNEPSNKLKNALLIQMTAAQNLNDENLFTTSLEKFENLFPNDKELPKAIFMHAMLCKDTGNLSQAEASLSLIKEKYKNFEDRESFLFEYGLLAHQGEKYQESYDTFTSYLSEFSGSERANTVWKLFLSSSVNLFKTSVEKENPEYTKQQFYTDLKTVLGVENLLTEEHAREYHLLFAKISFETGHSEEALSQLTKMVIPAFSEEDSQALAEANYIAALCHEHIGQDTKSFCHHLEEAIRLQPDLYNNANVHLQLYNGYLSLSGVLQDPAILHELENEHLELAASHLYRSISCSDNPVKAENKLWLANHYYQKLLKQIQTDKSQGVAESENKKLYLKRSTKLYASVLMNNNQLIEFTESKMDFEGEVLKYADLLERQNNQEKKLEVIAELISQQNANTGLKWNYASNALISLATTYDKMGDKERALETYQFINNSDLELPSLIKYHAAFSTSVLQYHFLTNDARKETNEKFLSIINNLKELQIKKHPFSEPVHLEAALEYAKIRAEAAEDSSEKHLFFLKRMKDDFSLESDSIAKNYQRLLKEYPEKQTLFTAYMKYVDAEVSRLEAIETQKAGDYERSKELNANALALLQELKQLDQPSKELHDRVISSIDAINK